MQGQYGPWVEDKVALRTLETVMTRGMCISRMVLLRGQGEVSAENLTRWDQEPGSE